MSDFSVQSSRLHLFYVPLPIHTLLNPAWIGLIYFFFIISYILSSSLFELMEHFKLSLPGSALISEWNERSVIDYTHYLLHDFVCEYYAEIIPLTAFDKYERADIVFWLSENSVWQKLQDVILLAVTVS